MCSNCSGDYGHLAPEREPIVHQPTGMRQVGRELHAAGFAPMSVQYTVFPCACGEEFASKRDLFQHLLEELSQ